MGVACRENRASPSYGRFLPRRRGARGVARSGFGARRSGARSIANCGNPSTEGVQARIFGARKRLRIAPVTWYTTGVATPADAAVRRAEPADADAIGRLLHDFNVEFDEPTPEPSVIADRIRRLMDDEGL